MSNLPETKKILELDALKINHLIAAYAAQFKNLSLISGGLLMGGATCFVYVFAALAPFITIDMLHMSSKNYGIANLLGPIGLVLGSLLSAQLAKQYQAKSTSGLVLDVNTGEIVAMVSLPDYDPNKPGKPTDLSRLNRLTTGVYEMGSTFKALTLAMALDAGREANGGHPPATLAFGYCTTS